MIVQLAVQQLLNIVKDPILIRDINGVVHFSNDAAKRFYGERLKLLTRRKSEWNRIVNQAHQMKQEFTTRVKRVNSKGYSFEMNLKIYALWDSFGKFEGAIEYLAQPESETQRPASSALAMAVVHDLRSPLAILQNLTVLMETRFDKRHTEMMRKQLEFCESIVTNFLEFAGEREPRKTAVSLEEILGEVISEIPLPDEVNLDIASVEGIMIEGDPGQIRHVVMNLIKNAVESMEGKPGVVKIGVNEQDEMLCLRITDDGPGIEPQDLVRVFQPFYSTKLRGFGLGLAACKQIVDAHGGKMEVESAPGKGTTFRVYLPLAG
ncbi:HAMP domain-containing histidine kinase [bacterium]|nr:HAMP domain-containing histidine kinase [bacterium]